MGLYFTVFQQFLEAKIHEFDKIPMEGVKGIDPSYRLWKSRVLPLNYTRNVKICLANLTLLERVISERNYLRSAFQIL